MDYFLEDHPFYHFNKYLYLKSGNHKMPVYLFKDGMRGILVEIVMPNNQINLPKATLYFVRFRDEYYWDLGKKIRTIENADSDYVYQTVAHKLEDFFNGLI